ncbi:hypothetical protein AMS68_002916 [Peltaster fructicola]|uniref:Acyl-coenzyme A oxidase n=1 Tax=Peltaster fructicola TaxID=286661 RepID=A0A6H0XRZ5_9PEZI|nr:hypothetical protein AMS68_002916 [Peltaster fructicola]
MSIVPQWVRDLKPSGPQGNFLFTKEARKRKHDILAALKSEKVFDKSQNYFSGRVDRFETALARAKKLRHLYLKHGWDEMDRQTANDLTSEPTPYGLHESMFLITLRDQTNDEQKEKYTKPANDYKFIGCYAQTELGHGSNVRGLETTATWNQEDQSFTIHTPYLTAGKWWIGSLGRTANHAIVMAQLIIKGKGYGPHPFIVQIRDLETHEPLPNIHIGDIGPKYGYNTMDNGYLFFNHVKVPHIAMLARFVSIDKETGKYKRPAAAALVYGTMTWVRSHIVLQAGGVLARGVTIATRYATVRRQFQDRDAPQHEKGENQVLNYTMVQIRLLPLLAACFALHFTGKAMMELYEANQNKLKAFVDGGDTGRSAGPEELQASSDMLADLHATSCGLKSIASYTAVEGLEVCRRACGGHGYSSFSGIGTYYADYLPTTHMGKVSNYILTQQVARYLLKSARSKQDSGCAYDVLGNDADIISAFAWRASYLTFEALKHRDVDKRSWNSLLVDFYRLSRSHSQYLMVKNFYNTLQSSQAKNELDPETVGVLHKLFRLFALHTLEQEAKEFYVSSAVTVRQIQLARTTTVMKLLEEIRPHAVRLVDSWDFSDWQMDSSLGRYDGRVCEDMFYRASELNPLNRVTVDPYPDSPVIFKKNESASLKSRL